MSGSGDSTLPKILPDHKLFNLNTKNLGPIFLLNNEEFFEDRLKRSCKHDKIKQHLII